MRDKRKLTDSDWQRLHAGSCAGCCQWPNKRLCALPGMGAGPPCWALFVLLQPVCWIALLPIPARAAPPRQLQQQSAPTRALGPGRGEWALSPPEADGTFSPRCRACRVATAHGSGVLSRHGRCSQACQERSSRRQLPGCSRTPRTATASWPHRMVGWSTRRITYVRTHHSVLPNSPLFSRRSPSRFTHVRLLPVRPTGRPWHAGRGRTLARAAERP